MKRNRKHLDDDLGSRLQIDAAVPVALASMLTESETSGGLLFSVAPGRAGGVIEAFRAAQEECWEIGEVLAEPVHPHPALSGAASIGPAPGGRDLTSDLPHLSCVRNPC